MAQSSLRERKVELTKESILEALVRLLSTHGMHDFSVQKVADEAGVAHRTVYRYFPTREALLEGLGEWLTKDFFRRDLGADSAFPELAVDDMPRTFEFAWAGFEQRAEATSALVTLTMGAKVGQQSREARSRWMKNIFAPRLAHLDEDDAEAVAALLRGLGSSTLWLHLRRYTDAKPTAMPRVVRWAVATLLRDLANGGGPSATTNEDE